MLSARHVPDDAPVAQLAVIHEHTLRHTCIRCQVGVTVSYMSQENWAGTAYGRMLAEQDASPAVEDTSLEEFTALVESAQAPRTTAAVTLIYLATRWVRTYSGEHGGDRFGTEDMSAAFRAGFTAARNDR